MLVPEPQTNIFLPWGIPLGRTTMATARKTSTPPGAIPLSNERIAGVLKDIRGYMDRYLPHFHRCDTGENATEFVLGLLSKLPRKSAEPISEIFDRERKVFQRLSGIVLGMILLSAQKCPGTS